MPNPDPTSLDNLRDIVPGPPIPISFAPGLYFLTAFAFALLGWAVWYERRRWKANAYRRSALAKLKALEARASSADQRGEAVAEVAALLKRTALAALGGVGFRHGPLTLDFSRAANHPVTRNFESLALTDETYWKMTGSLAGDRLLASAVEEGAPQPQLWSVEHGRGRVFVSIPGHYSWTFDDPLFRVLLLRAIAWSAHEPVDRLNDLVWPGAEMAK